MTGTTYLFIALAYFIGAVPFAVLVSKGFGLADPRSYGSGNPGATNVLRSGRKSAAVLTLLGDALKGTLAVWLMGRFGSSAPLPIALAGMAAFIGHVFPVTLGFKGGKGVATAVGVLGAFSGWVALGSLAVWIVAALVFRYSSLAAVLAALSAPVFAHWLIGAPAITAACVLMALILVWRHAGNMRRLLAGSEPKIGGKKPSA